MKAMAPCRPGLTVDTPPQAVGLISDEARELDIFVDHSQIVQLECLRRRIWGTKSLWGRVVTYPGGERG
jgi:phosphosulfolactate synthase (CoM biosynthesis protein A)